MAHRRVRLPKFFLNKIPLYMKCIYATAAGAKGIFGIISKVDNFPLKREKRRAPPAPALLSGMYATAGPGHFMLLMRVVLMFNVFLPIVVFINRLTAVPILEYTQHRFPPT